MTSINTRAAHTAAVARMADLSRQLDTVQGQIATGRRIDTPADDPAAFARAAVLRRDQAAATATQRGIDAGNRRLQASDTVVAGLVTIVQRAQELALQGANGTLSATDRGTLALELRELDAQMRALAETRDSDGQRLFAGAVANGPAYAPDGSGLPAWQGGGTAPAVRIGNSLVASGAEGPEIFGVTDAAADRRDLFATMAALQTALGEPDADLRQAGLDQALVDLDGHVTRLADARGTLGARLGRLESESERLADTRFALEADLSTIESLDMAEAIARLQRLRTVLDAAQASFARIASLSLWDQLR